MLINENVVGSVKSKQSSRRFVKHARNTASLKRSIYDRIDRMCEEAVGGNWREKEVEAKEE
jgi:hypothetical protein